jgi:type I restriction enzyme S subunit
VNFSEVEIGELAHSDKGSFKIGPFGSSLKKNELVDSGIPVVGIENVLPNHFSTQYRKFITPEKYQQLSQYTIRPGDVLVTTMGTIGRAAVVPQNIDTMIIDSHLFRMRVDQKKVFPPYLCFALNGFDGLIQQIENKSRGAIMAGLNTTILKECTIPLPPLDEQKHIAAILSKADRLRRLRRYARTLSDGYLQSVFLEMFGYTFTGDDKETPLVPLQEICTKITDGTHHTPKYQDTGIPFLSVKNITKYPGTLDFSDIKYISEEEHRKIWKRCPVERSDILYTKVGTYGIPQIVDTDTEFSIFVSVALLKPDKHVVIPKYLETALRSNFAKSQADKLVSGISVPDLHLREIKTIVIPLPPLPLQQKFAQIVQQYERLRAQQRESARQAEQLFQSLLHGAFKGEL